MNYVDRTFKSPLTSISIGPGIRGIERGVERIVRLEHLAYVEIEAFIVENLVAQMECGVLAPAVIWSDGKTLPCEPFRGIVDIILAGYPCQPFSTAGKRRGAEDPRHLYPYIERAIRIIRPRICFFENVRGHVTSGLPEVIASLEGLGYRVHWGIYSAEETGAAHKRERVFIMAYSTGAGKRRGERYIHQENGRPDGKLPLIANGSSPELENPTGIRCRPLGTKSEGFQRGTVTNHASDELADTHNNGERTSTGETPRQSGEIKGQEQREERDEIFRERVRSEFGNGSKRMDNAGRKGLEGTVGGKSAVTTKSVARPGQPQHEWESPRTIITDDAARLLGGYGKKYPEAFQKGQIEQVAFDGFTGKVVPHLDLSAHGYHFREDILRALGNSVYEDTAELAFRDLTRKHGIAL